jgi:hypothetical protein
MNTRTRSSGAAGKVVSAIIGAGHAASAWQPAHGPAPAPTHDYPEPAPADSPVVSELHAIGNQLERLQHAIGVLYARLEPVSVQPPAGSTDPSSPAFGGSPLVQQLAQRRSAIANAASRLEDLAGYLEV